MTQRPVTWVILVILVLKHTNNILQMSTKIAFQNSKGVACWPAYNRHMLGCEPSAGTGALQA